MLFAHELHRALHNILIDSDGTIPCTERVLGFAADRNLDLQDTATLCRVAAGEAHLDTVYETKPVTR